MRYCLNLSRIGLLEYRDLLKAQNLLPGRRMLLDDIDRNFASLLAQGIETLEHLRQRLATPPKLAALSAASGISEGYLKLLKRESGSFEQAPVPLASFPGLDAALLASLRQVGIINSRDYFERGADQTGELYHLCDLVRINGVGALAAKAFYDAGFTTVHDVAMLRQQICSGGSPASTRSNNTTKRIWAKRICSFASILPDSSCDIATSVPIF